MSSTRTLDTQRRNKPIYTILTSSFNLPLTKFPAKPSQNQYVSKNPPPNSHNLPRPPACHFLLSTHLLLSLDHHSITTFSPQPPTYFPSPNSLSIPPPPPPSPDLSAYPLLKRTPSPRFTPQPSLLIHAIPRPLIRSTGSCPDRRGRRRLTWVSSFKFVLLGRVVLAGVVEVFDRCGCEGPCWRGRGERQLQ